jgi:K(+)-stimulated pyrophosphate-energized sodium pump
MDILMIAPISGVASIIVAIFLYFRVKNENIGTPKMKKISDGIREGALAFMKRQYMTLTGFSAIMAILIAVFLDYNQAFSFIFGSICSAIAGFLGMDVALHANVRTAQAARKSLKKAFSIGFYGGAVMGLAVVGLALLGVSLLYYVYYDPLDVSYASNIILGFSFGASTIALFAKAGGGIYTKTADIGADLVGKIEMNIPEDDPRNPAVIADNVGDNVGDVAGMGADLFDSYVAGILAAMVIGGLTLGVTGVILPLLIKAFGIFASIIGLFFVRVRGKGSPGSALNRGTYITCVIFAIFAFLLIYYLEVEMSIFYATLTGLIVGIIIGLTSDYFTSIDRGPAKNTAEASKTGAAINILTGFSYGLISIAPPLIGIAIATIISHQLAGIFGITMSAVGIMATAGMIVSADAYGPIVDNAKGIAEMSGLGEEVIARADRLDAAGNTAKAITKGFAISSAGLTVIALLVVYAEVVGIETVNFMDPFVMAGTIIGVSIPPFLSALMILGVGKNAFRMIEEVRRQFKEIPGLIEGKAQPDYARCVDIATKGALKELILPGVLTISTPLVVGFILGTSALGGFLVGSILSGMVLAFLMSNAGGLWDNAKKYIEDGKLGGKGSDAHKAAVTGDTVGDPFKDTAGPSINTLLVVMSLTASMFAELIALHALLG